MDKDTGVVLRHKKDGVRGRRCKVVFSYKQDHEDELNLNVGDIIEILGEEEEGWWRGVLNGKVGVFPSNFVEEISHKIGSKESITENEHSPSSKPRRILCEVKYPYKAENEDELTLNEGDIVTLISKDGQDPGWWKGELNGVVGVFPDNFVVLLPQVDDKTAREDKKEDKKVAKSPHETGPLKPNSIALQRKSIENKDKEETKTPPIPSKKPIVPIKKSPSSGSSGGLFSGIKKKIVDVVDGASGSKNISPPKSESVENNNDNVFDQVERGGLLSDVRATRAKAPGRRPPSAIFKDDESGIVNGNANLESLPEHNNTLHAENDDHEVKPKLREWEKHKLPWLNEMKLNQAKRSSTSPETKIKHHTIETSEDSEKDPDTTKFIKQKSPPPETDKSPKQKPVITPISRPQTIVAPPTSVPPVKILKTPSPVTTKMEKLDKASEARSFDHETITFKQYSELLERLHKLEVLVEKQNLIHMAAIEELKGKLQIETEMRHLLQLQLDKLETPNIMQV